MLSYLREDLLNHAGGNYVNYLNYAALSLLFDLTLL